MTQLKNAKGEPLRLLLKPGQTMTLPGGRGSISFDSVQRWAGLSIRYDPGKLYALLGAFAALGGLIASLMIRRRRVFVRVQPTGRRTVISIGGLAKGEDPGLAATIEDLLSAIAQRTVSPATTTTSMSTTNTTNTNSATGTSATGKSGTGNTSASDTRTDGSGTKP
jgi:cytochrome c biogenesis protein